jgi:large subunit ribosomal protein L4e
MKTANILDINGKKKKTIELPECFSEPVREDLIIRAVEIKKSQQPFSPSLVSGKQHSASGVIIHQRKVWKSGYGRGISRIPRKIMSRRGSQFNWEGAEVSNTKGGRTAHPPKSISRIKTKKINKKELRKAFASSLSATCDEKFLKKRYKNLEKIENLPLVVESKITSFKAKEFCSLIKNILGKDVFKIAEKNKKIRSGKGKMRGRKYKKNAGLLIVLGDKEKLKTSKFDIKNVRNLGVSELASGGPGRLTLYTEQAIKGLANKFNSLSKTQTKELKGKLK